MSYSPRRRLEDGVVASLAQVCQIYGLPPTVGRLYALLFVSPVPLSLAELAEGTGAAKSTTSVALRRLERYRLVHRLPRGSDRKDYYVPVTDVFEIIQDWMRLFVQPELGVGEQMVSGMARDLDAAGERGEYDDDGLSTMRERVAQMRRALALGTALVGSLARAESDDLLAVLGVTPQPNRDEENEP